MSDIKRHECCIDSDPSNEDGLIATCDDCDWTESTRNDPETLEAACDHHFRTHTEVQFVEVPVTLRVEVEFSNLDDEELSATIAESVLHGAIGSYGGDCGWTLDTVRYKDKEFRGG